MTLSRRIIANSSRGKCSHTSGDRQKRNPSAQSRPENQIFRNIRGKTALERSFAAGFRRFLGVPPPYGRECGHSVFWHRLRVTESIPPCGSEFRVAPLRHNVLVPQQHTVERLGCGDEIGAILGEDHPLDQRVDCRILDARIVARAGLVGGGRAPVAALLVAWRQRLTSG